jgi:hypothetical protein
MEERMNDLRDSRNDLGWWVISGEMLMELLRRAAGGEDVDLLYAEAYANSKIEKHGEL